jgi:hypothetical protein
VLLLGATRLQLGPAERGDLLCVDAAVASPYRVDHLGTEERPHGVIHDRVRSPNGGRSGPTGTLDQLGVDLYGYGDPCPTT